MLGGYVWRKLSPSQREELLEWREARRHPLHSPPHFHFEGTASFHISAACFEHAPIIGFSGERLDAFQSELVETLNECCAGVPAWCVLPNHYHALVQTEDLLAVIDALGKLHGRSSWRWNQEESYVGRQVFCRASDRRIRSERHFWAAMNYVHNNAVHHGYAEKWTEWPWGSAAGFLERVGREEAERIWRGYPVKGFGEKWDRAED